MTTPPPLPQIPPASLAAFDKWLNQGNSSGCNESMWKAWQAALATQQKVVAIPEPSDDEVDLLLAEIDQIARNYDHHDYGLPTHADDSVASMRAQVQWFFESWTRHPQPLAGQQDRGEAENIREGAPYDNPKFEALCREHGIWGTPQAALCAVFWRAAPSGGDAAAQGAAWKCSRCGSRSVDACNGVGCFAGENSAPIEDWQSIETVPQSEDRFLVISRSGRITIDTGHFMHNMMHAAKVDGDECFYTHWMRIPAPPSIGPSTKGVDHG